MRRIVLIALAALPLHAHAQDAGGSSPIMAKPMHHHMAMGPVPTQPGQSAFAAIQEIVAMLEADPATDWSRVNIDALRQHLVDMDNVVLRASVTEAPVDGGIRFDVAGEGTVRDSIRRMISAHARAMEGAEGWHYVAAETPDGAALTVLVPPADAVKLHALGFFGIVASGMHHQVHHMAIARGDNPHAAQ